MNYDQDDNICPNSGKPHNYYANQIKKDFVPTDEQDSEGNRLYIAVDYVYGMCPCGAGKKTRV